MYGEATFTKNVSDYLPEYQDLPVKDLRAAYERLTNLVRARMNAPIARKELEEALRGNIPATQPRPLRSIQVHTSIETVVDEDSHKLCFEWAPFFGGVGHSFPPPEDWNEKVVSALKQTRDWIMAHRSTRRIRLSGARRLSATFAIGHVFSSVAGFTLEMEYRAGALWATDAYPETDAVCYRLTPRMRAGTGTHLACSIGILRDISVQVETALENSGLSHMPVLHLSGADPIETPQQANAIVHAVKHHLSNAMTDIRADFIHLFVAGPSYLALLLGHRFNALAPVQFYEWISSGHYVPTCRLP